MNKNIPADERRAVLGSYTYGDRAYTYQEAASTLFPVTSTGGRCDGYGNIHLGYDSDYECGGCTKCRKEPAVLACLAIGRFIWSAAALQTRTELSNAVMFGAALARIGSTFTALAAMANAISSFLCSAIEAYETVIVGRCYKIVGKRGNAKTLAGTVGECRWVGESTFSKYRASNVVSRTLKVGLKIEGQDKLVYVAASQVARVPSTLEAAERAEAAAERATRKFVLVNKGCRAYVWAGPCKGAHGIVFWTGTGKAGARYGIDINPARPAKTPRGYRASDAHTLWVDAVDCAPFAFGSDEHIDHEVLDLTAANA